MAHGIFTILLFGFFVQDIKSATGIPLQDLRNFLNYGFYSTHRKIGLGLLGCSAVAMRYGVRPKVDAQIVFLVGCVGYMYGIYEGIKTVRNVINQYLPDFVIPRLSVRVEKEAS